MAETAEDKVSLAGNAGSITEEEYKTELINRIHELTVIIEGLEFHDPYLKMVNMIKETTKIIDDRWHMIHDPVKLNEARITKYASDTIINYIPNLKGDLHRFQIELGKLENPDDFINKDYDER